MNLANIHLMQKQWFESWFDSPYYHILYRNRDDQEARHFIDNLIDHLNPSVQASMLDLACGKGRHSRYLAAKGYSVTGIDLSTQNIEFARQFESKDLSFYTQDMRKTFRINYFDFIFNFFTSFGYFDTERDHVKTLENIAKGLKSDGIFVLDYLNAVLIEKSIRRRRQKTIDGICFKMRSQVKDGYISKKIRFENDGKQYNFEERVRAFHLNDFKRMMGKAGLQILEVYGDYDLNPYIANQSERLIIIAKKQNK